MDKGLVHIYCGNGKGKTSASVGLAVRAAGSGKKVLFVQFLKGLFSGEVAALEQLSHVTLLRGKALKKFSWNMSEEEKAFTRRNDDVLLESACSMAQSEEFDMLILDEAIDACNTQLLDEKELLACIKHKPSKLELVITGRNPSEALLATADYVTEMNKVKHPYDKGVMARKGIEY